LSKLLGVHAPCGEDFLALVDELRARGAMTVTWGAFSATFHAPHEEPVALAEDGTPKPSRRIDLEPDEREELAKLREGKIMLAELGLVDES